MLTAEMPNTNTQYTINFVKSSLSHMEKIKELYPVFNGLSFLQIVGSVLILTVFFILSMFSNSPHSI